MVGCEATVATVATTTAGAIGTPIAAMRPIGTTTRATRRRPIRPTRQPTRRHHPRSP
jgi:hypothetical protein